MTQDAHVNSLLHRDSDNEEHEAPHGDREITLGTTMILAIFFALAVFAAIFFGFGYSMGSKRAAANATVAGDAAVAMPTSTSTGKPAAGNVSSGSAAAAVHNDDEPGPASSRAAEAKSSALQRIVASPSHAQPAPVAALPAAPALPAAQQPVVQIAAVSHQQDANLLVSTLKGRGYNVTIHADPYDKLLHVQVGPFATRPEAQAMRQRLIADGFNAIVKDLTP